MTRDEAEMLAIKVVGFEFSEDARRHLAILEALGLLKLDEPKKEPTQRLMDRMGTATHPSHIPGMLADLGLKIVEK